MSHNAPTKSLVTVFRALELTWTPRGILLAGRPASSGKFPTSCFEMQISFPTESLALILACETQEIRYDICSKATSLVLHTGQLRGIVGNEVGARRELLGTGVKATRSSVLL